MEWIKLLSNERLHDRQYEEQPNRSIFTQDYDRIVFSEPFRRLANKTQVPLRANKSETIEWLKFTLEGVGERTHGYAFEDTAF
jgi:dGTP triphosphohydrolase